MHGWGSKRGMSTIVCDYGSHSQSNSNFYLINNFHAEQTRPVTENRQAGTDKSLVINLSSAGLSTQTTVKGTTKMDFRKPHFSPFVPLPSFPPP